MNETAKEAIKAGKAVLGIEFGSTRIKAVLVDGSHTPIAMGTYDWENRLENNIWTYSLEDIRKGLQGCYKSLADRDDLRCGIGFHKTAFESGIDSQLGKRTYHGGRRCHHTG